MDGSAYQFQALLACFCQSWSIVSGLIPISQGTKEQDNGVKELDSQPHTASILPLPLRT